MAAYDRGPECAAIIGVLLGLAWLFFSLRMYVKLFLTKGFGVDDVLLIIAIILFTTYNICGALGVKYGTGRHLVAIPPQDIPKALHFWFLCELFYTLTTVFIRLSIAVFLIRICLKRIYKFIIYTTMAMVTGFSIFYFFLVLFQCSPVDFFWNQYKGAKGHCMNPRVVPDASYAHSVVSFTADWVLGLLPVALIWNLQMNRRTKISLAGILAIGLLAGVAAMIRIPYIRVLTITDDFLYATTDVAIWSTVEAGLGIVAASAFTLRPLFRSLYSMTSRSTHGYGDHTAKGTITAGGYKKNASRAGGDSRAQQGPHMGIPLHQNTWVGNARADANGYANTGNGSMPGVASTRSPFGDSNEDVTQEQPGQPRGSESDGSGSGIQVHRTFEVTTQGEDEEWPAEPWKRGEGTGSSVSIV